MLAGPQLLARLRAISPISVDGLFARRVPLAALLGLKEPIQPGMVTEIVTPGLLIASTRPYRYNREGIDTLYLGESEDVAGAEVKQEPGLSGFARNPRPPDSIYHVEVDLTAVLDLMNPEIQRILDTNIEELIAPWRLRSPDAPTQVLGTAALNTGRFEAIRFPSAPMHRVGQRGASLVIFKNALHSGSKVEAYDPTGIWRERWP